MATKLILIRHGATDWNLKKRYCGLTDIGLNETGKAQARCLHKRLKKELIHKVYSSDRKRAFQTAKIIFKGREIEKITELEEMGFGRFEGLTYSETMKKFKRVYKKWLKDPFGVTIPDGENLEDFKKRVIRTIKNIILINKNKTVAIVSHGGPLGIFLNYILKSRDFWKQIPASASLSIVECTNGKLKIKLLNDTSHLGSLGKDID